MRGLGAVLSAHVCIELIAVFAVKFNPEDFVVSELILLFPFPDCIVALEVKVIICASSDGTQVKSTFCIFTKEGLDSGPDVPFL